MRLDNETTIHAYLHTYTVPIHVCMYWTCHILLVVCAFTHVHLSCYQIQFKTPEQLAEEAKAQKEEKPKEKVDLSIKVRF